MTFDKARPKKKGSGRTRKHTPAADGMVPMMIIGTAPYTVRSPLIKRTRIAITASTSRICIKAPAL